MGWPRGVQPSPTRATIQQGGRMAEKKREKKLMKTAFTMETEIPGGSFWEPKHSKDL